MHLKTRSPMIALIAIVFAVFAATVSAFAAPGPFASPTAPQPPFVGYLILICLVLVYFFLWRPLRRQQRMRFFEVTRDECASLISEGDELIGNAADSDHPNADLSKASIRAFWLAKMAYSPEGYGLESYEAHEVGNSQVRDAASCLRNLKSALDAMQNEIAEARKIRTETPALAEALSARIACAMQTFEDNMRLQMNDGIIRLIQEALVVIARASALNLAAAPRHELLTIKAALDEAQKKMDTVERYLAANVTLKKPLTVIGQVV